MVQCVKTIPCTCRLCIINVENGDLRSDQSAIHHHVGHVCVRVCARVCTRARMREEDYLHSQ